MNIHATRVADDIAATCTSCDFYSQCDVFEVAGSPDFTTVTLCDRCVTSATRQGVVFS